MMGFYWLLGLIYLLRASPVNVWLVHLYPQAGGNVTSDVICRLFGTTVTTVASGQCPGSAAYVFPESTNTSP